MNFTDATKAPYLIAEVGSNWQTLDHCLESIKVAKECGADAVKFQAFNWRSLYGVSQFHIDPAFAHRDNHIFVPDNKMPHELPLDWLPQLKARADELGIDFMVTAFSPKLVRAVDPFVKMHKIASSDAATPQMLDAVIETRKPFLVSSGGKTNEEKARIGQYLSKHCLDNRAMPMHCVAAYPADYVDLSPIMPGVGFSDHTLGYTVTVMAAKFGASVIEKHFTAFPELDTPDRPHSLTPAQFKDMVSIIRGDGPTIRYEADMITRHNRRLIAIRDISHREELKFGVNYGAYRSLERDTRGASPFDWERIESKYAKCEIKRGKGIALEDVQ